MTMQPVLFFQPPHEAYRPVLIAPDELYSSVVFSPPSPAVSAKLGHWRMAGPYDAYAEAMKMTGGEMPSMVMCQWCCSDSSIPHNLGPLTCPKILLVSDTHHTPRPLTRAVKLATSEPWDLIVCQFNPHHCHWFHEAGCKAVAYIPCFEISPVEMPPPAKRTRGVTFVGNISPDHVWRRYVIDELRRRGVDVEVFSGVSRDHAALIYNESLVSLNPSLNGDFNLRNLEIAAAGGFCVADFTVDEMQERIRYATTQPDSSLAESDSDYEWFQAHHTPAHKIAALHEALAGKNLFTCETKLFDLWHRIALYEQVQELNLRGKWHWPDFDDLPRRVMT